MERTPTAIVRVHRPELTAEERERRMKQIREAAERLVAAVARREAAHGRNAIHRAQDAARRA